MQNVPGLMVTKKQLEDYSKYLEVGMIVTAPILITPNDMGSKTATKKETNTQVEIIGVYPHFVRVKGLKKEGVHAVKYIDLYTRNAVPKEILETPFYTAEKDERVIKEDSDF